MEKNEDFENYYTVVEQAIVAVHKTVPDRDLVEKMYLNRYTVGEAITSIREKLEKSAEQ